MAKFKQPEFTKPLSPWEQIQRNSEIRCNRIKDRNRNLQGQRALKSNPATLQAIVVINPMKKEQND
jgi:hypothetical protein